MPKWVKIMAARKRKTLIVCQNVTTIFSTGATMGLLSQVTESRVIRKSVKHGSEGGGWKSALSGNSLAAHPTHVRFGSGGGVGNCPADHNWYWPTEYCRRTPTKI